METHTLRQNKGGKGGVGKCSNSQGIRRKASDLVFPVLIVLLIVILTNDRFYITNNHFTRALCCNCFLRDDRLLQRR